MIATSKLASVVPTATATFTLPVKYIISVKNVVIYIYQLSKLITISLTTLFKIYEKLELTNVQVFCSKHLCVKLETVRALISLHI